MGKLSTHLKPGPKPRHGGFTFLKDGSQIPAHRKHIESYLTALRGAVIADLGPTEDDMTALQVLAVDRLIMITGCVRLMEESAADTGKLPANSYYLSFNNTILKICGLLGIDRKATEKPQEFLDYIKEYDEKKKAEKK